jgi:hypothetical protein
MRIERLAGLEEWDRMSVEGRDRLIEQAAARAESAMRDTTDAPRFRGRVSMDEPGGLSELVLGSSMPAGAWFHMEKVADDLAYVRVGERKMWVRLSPDGRAEFIDEPEGVFRDAARRRRLR